MTAERAKALLGWYRSHRRQLPWRRHDGPADPYQVLVSELMLQQTRVDTVIPYFQRWLARWPDFEALAQAPLDDVLEAWAGLGYYSRARNLHRAAQAVVTEHGGALPGEAKALARLPGVGPYTVGALLSIGLGRPAALVDGNVARVLSRWYALRAPPAETAAKKALWSLAGELALTPAAADDPSAWSQALMELGATVCDPKRPKCGDCPVARWCQAHSLKLTESIPAKTPKKAPKRVEAVYVLLTRSDGAVWLSRRPATGRWAGLWEPLGAEGPDAASALLSHMKRQVALTPLPPLTHVLTHRRYEVRVFHGEWRLETTPEPELFGYVDGRWWCDTSDEPLALSRLATKLLETLSASSRQLDLLPLASGPATGSNSGA